MPSRHPKTMHRVSGHSLTHRILNLTPPQFVATNWKVWLRCMVWTWEVWTPSPGLLLYTQSSGQLNQKRIPTHTLMSTFDSFFAFPTQSNSSLKRYIAFVLSIFLVYHSPFLYMAFAHRSLAYITHVMPLHIKTLCAGRPEQAPTAPPNTLYSRWRTRTVPHSFPAFIFISVTLQSAKKYLASNTHPSCTLKTHFPLTLALSDTEWGMLSVFG